jgi:hypothetical protein
LLKGLASSENGVSIHDQNFNSFAYADDVSLLSGTVPGLQELINMCADYAKMWRFNFGIKKSKCMIVGEHSFKEEPSWMLNDAKLINCDRLEVLGVTFTKQYHSSAHVEQRIQKCRSSMYSLAEIGMCYPGLSSDVKAHIWRSVCLPTLLYGCESVCLREPELRKMESTQGKLIKQVLGLSKRSHTSHLIQALDIYKVENVIGCRIVSLFRRIFQVESPCHKLCMLQLNRYMLTGYCNKDTLIGRIVSMGLSPIKIAFSDSSCKYKDFQKQPMQDGITDSIKFLVMQANFIKPYSEEHVLVKLLSQTF